jgi:sugar phosphate isomerase/epimerase
LKLCLNTLIWSGLPLADALRAASELGVNTLELGATPECAHLNPLGGREALAELRATLQGFEVAAVAADHPHLSRREEEGGDEAVSHTIGAIKRAGDLGARVVTVTLGATEVDAWDTAWERAFTALRMVLYHTARSKVKVAVLVSTEDVLNSVRKARRMLDAIENPRLGLALDTGFLQYQRIQLTEALLVAGERLHHVRLRDGTRTDPDRAIGEGEVNFAAAVKHLRQHGYQGALSLSVTDPQKAGAAVAQLQQLLES